MTLPIWKSEWVSARRRNRLMFLNIVIPLTLVTPIAFSAAPPAHAAAVFAVLFVLFGTFGSCIPLVRDSRSGLLGRYVVAGADRGSLVLQRVAASAALDTLELAPSLAVILVANRASPAQVLELFLACGAALVAASLLGAWAAIVAHSIAEGALFSAVTALLMLHAAGTFRTPLPGSRAATIAEWMPVGPLHDGLSALLGSSTRPHGPPMTVLPVLALVFGVFATWGLGRSWLGVRRR